MIDYKFRENELIAEFKEYIDSTYNQHYSTNKFQSTEIIIDRGHGTGFCMGNVDKYSNRYGKKGTRADARKDLMKVLHYALIQLYIHDKEDKEIEDLFSGFTDDDFTLELGQPDTVSLDISDISINLSEGGIGDDGISSITISGVNDEH